ncbi:MAG: hypothetical protein RL728_1029 [Bacteroidota bacterium]|jgi:hypothetical protein
MSLLTNESLLFFYSGALFLYILNTFWRENEPKHILINLILYWAVVAILIPYSIITNKSLNELTKYGKSDMKLATWIGLIALTFYTIGVQSSLLDVRTINFNSILKIINRYNGRRIILIYIAISFLSVLLNASILQIPGGQLLLSVVYMKWVLLTLLILHTSVNKKNRNLVILIILIETLLSFGGFWAAFKDYVLVGIGAYLMMSPRLNLKSTFILIFVGSITLLLSVIWTYSKGEYRKFLTGGERTQYVVEQDQLNNIIKFIEIASKDFSPENISKSFSEGIENLVYRVSYVEFLALSINQVPTYLPHEQGRLLKNAFEHVLKPRFLFPEKKPIYDSELTSKYTGVQFSGADQGASFSLGTVAESYVDFGKYYMFIPILFFGLWLGWIYRYFILNGYNVVWGMCYSAPIFQFAWSFPIPTTKFLGWSITYFVGFWFLNKFLIQYLDAWLLQSKTGRS